MGRDDKELILEEISVWPETVQDDFLTSLQEAETKFIGVYQLSDDERAAVRRGLAEARAGQFASDEEVAAVFDRFR